MRTALSLSDSEEDDMSEGEDMSEEEEETSPKPKTLKLLDHTDPSQQEREIVSLVMIG